MPKPVGRLLDPKMKGGQQVYTADQLRTYGDARAEHARRVALEEAAGYAENYDLGTPEGHDIARCIRSLAGEAKT